MNIIDAVQGTQEWHAHRAHHFNASDVPAMLGLSPYKTRSALLAELATGITPEIDPATQRRFDDGHRFEALARPVAEKIIGEELFPVVGHEGKLSASFDGLTMDGSVCFEHKTLNAEYRDAVASGGKLPKALLVQIEQQLWVSQAERCLFMASKWTPDGELVEEVHCMVESDPALLNEVIKGWDQFQHDLENYQHPEVIATPVAATIEALPALFVQVEGKVLATNLDVFKQAAQTFIEGIKTELVNDQDFADADKMVKFLKDGEERLALAKQQALAQTASIDELFRTVDAISEQMRSKRLALDKLVKAEKVNRKAEIISKARAELQAHIAKLNERIGGAWVTYPVDAQFAAVTTGLKSLDSMRDKVATALANAKIEANELADRIELNAKQITVGGANYNYLVHDFAQICAKPTDDFAAIMAQRIAAHKAAESEKAEAAKKAEDARIAAAVEAERVRAASEADKLVKQAAPLLDHTKQAGEVIPPQAVALEPEARRAVLIDAGDDVLAYLNTLDLGDKEFGRLRAVLMGYEQFKADRAMKAAS